MITTIYKGIWAVFAMAVAVLWLGGWLGNIAFTALGIAAFGIIYFGMMFVLPYSITHPSEKGEHGSGQRLFSAVFEKFGLFDDSRDPSMRNTSLAHHSHRPGSMRIY